MSRFFLIGFMACGKTTIGRIAAQKTGLHFIDVDELIEEREGKSIPQIFAAKGEGEFRQLENKYLQETLGMENTIIATGGGLPCFNNNMHLMNNSGDTIYLKFLPEELKIRIQLSPQNTRPLVAGKNDEELLLFIKESLSEREQYYNQAKHLLQGTDEKIAEAITEIIRSKIS